MMGKKSSQAETDRSQGDGAVDKIRDLLFGAEMQDYEHRFKALEDSIAAGNQRLIDEMNNRLSKLELDLAQQMEKLDEKRESERGERIDAIAGLDRAFQDNVETVRQSIEQIEQRYRREYQDLTQLVQNQASDLSTEIGQLNEEIKGSLTQESERLQEVLVNRGELAEFFKEFSVRLQRGGTDTSVDG